MATTIIILLMAILLFIFAGCAFNDNEIGFGIFMLIFGIGVLFAGAIKIGGEAEENGKKIGQVDALTGKVYYELKTQPDSTREWVLIKENK